MQLASASTIQYSTIPASAITAAVVGVVLNLAVWFSLHTLFTNVTTTEYLSLRLQIPDFASANIAACAVAVLACLLTFYRRKGMFLTLGVSVALGAVLYICKV